ncbi:hypothetical protein F5Y02DRAFT_415443 [Annulohypoxylon stygium]|nr:hypothetical protein F5Y02DRAFT_415443 [Annulohypoxylon stygium]
MARILFCFWNFQSKLAIVLGHPWEWAVHEECQEHKLKQYPSSPRPSEPQQLDIRGANEPGFISLSVDPAETLRLNCATSYDLPAVHGLTEHSRYV